MKQCTKEEIPEFAAARVLVVGDVMLDRYFHGDTARISPEAPVPVVKIRDIEERPGGAGNVALNVAALGCKTTLLGIIGDDLEGMRLETQLQEANIACDMIRLIVPTISKSRVIGRNQQLIRFDCEQRVTFSQSEMLLPIYKQHLNAVDIVILSDYGKGTLTCAKELISIARKANIPVLVDPKSKDFKLYQGASIITPNYGEFEAIVGDCHDEAEIASRGQDLVGKYQLDALLVTRGSKGMSLIEATKPPLHIPTKAREVYDVTGAGDTVISTLAAALAVGEDLQQAVMLANLAAGIVVRKLGAVSVSVSELRHALQYQQDSWACVLGKQQLLEEVLQAKAQGECIVMTNGCFDILHAGHIAYLEQAKALGTRLIVAINSDDSVKRLKGSKRPINSLAKRMAVVAGLKPVDWVVAFSEDTPRALIAKILPDVLVKGGDYKVEEIAGAKEVMQNGGKVKVLSFIPDHSSSFVVEKMEELDA